MSEQNYYVIGDNNCKYISMTKEQILAAIEQILTTGEITDVDTGFVTMIKDQNGGAGLKFWIGTNAEYNALTDKEESCFYIITDDTTNEDIDKAIAEVTEKIKTLESETGKIISGETVVPKASFANTAQSAAAAQSANYASTAGSATSATNSTYAGELKTIGNYGKWVSKTIGTGTLSTKGVYAFVSTDDVNYAGIAYYDGVNMAIVNLGSVSLSIDTDGRIDYTAGTSGTLSTVKTRLICRL